MIPTLIDHVRRLRKLRYRMALLQGSREALPELLEAVDEDGMYYCVRKEIGLNKQYHKLAHEFFERIDKVMVSGVILTDLDEGLVDFPHKLDGRSVLLCWKAGEKGITHWHEVDETYDERQEIVDLDRMARELGMYANAGQERKRRA